MKKLMDYVQKQVIPQIVEEALLRLNELLTLNEKWASKYNTKKRFKRKG